jgi:hypothetical protein
MRGLDAFTAPLGAVVAAVSWRIHLSPRFSQISGALDPCPHEPHLRMDVWKMRAFGPHGSAMRFDDEEDRQSYVGDREHSGHLTVHKSPALLAPSLMLTPQHPRGFHATLQRYQGEPIRARFP